MTIIDTNVVLRYLLRDHEGFYKEAEAFVLMLPSIKLCPLTKKSKNVRTKLQRNKGQGQKDFMKHENFR